MLLDTLNKRKQPIQKGTKLYCYNTSYGFRSGYKYTVFNTKDDIIVKDRDGIEVIFSNAEELNTIFKIFTN